MALKAAPVGIFCIYARADADWYQRLQRHLSPLQREGQIVLRDGYSMLAGEDRFAALKNLINRSSIILLLVSPDFFSDHYCYEVQYPLAKELDSKHQAKIIPILLRPTFYQDAPFAHLEPLPTNRQPITSWSDHDAALMDVAKGIDLAGQHLSPAMRRKPAVQPRFNNVPHLASHFFLGHDDALARLVAHLWKSSTIYPQAICGPGGIGKTQLALEYIRQYGIHYDAILWAIAASRESLGSSFVEIARLLNLDIALTQEQNTIMQIVWEQLQSSVEWLLVLDNADDLEMISTVLPSQLSGHVLLTTQAQAPGQLAQSIKLEPFPSEVGALFLLRRATLLEENDSLESVPDATRELAAQISQDLGGLPLALDQAGAYLEKTGGSLAAYRTYIQRYRQSLFSELQGVGTNYRSTVATTWSVAFEKVEQANPLAADLLRLCAFLEADAIPEEIISEGMARLTSRFDPLKDSREIDKSMEILRAYSLVQRNPHNQTFSLHRLVQMVLEDAMPEQEKTQWAELAVHALCYALPDEDSSQWAGWERLLPHARKCVTWIEQCQLTIPKAIVLLVHVGMYLFKRGQYQEAGQALQQALDIQQQLRTRGQYQILVALQPRLARAYVEQGRYDLAESLLKDGLALSRKHFGEKSRQTAGYLQKLAYLYIFLQRYDEAELLCQRALKLFKKLAKGKDDHNVADCLNILGFSYERQNKHQEAERKYRASLEIFEKTPGDNNLDTATNKFNLGYLYEKQGRYKEAEELYRQTLHIQQLHLSELHPEVGKTLHHLAELASSQGKYQEAEELYQQALPILHKTLGPEHKDTRFCLQGLGTIYFGQKKYQDARKQFQQLLKNAKEDDANTGILLNNLATVYQALEDYDALEPLYKRARVLLSKTLGEDHPEYAKLLFNLGSLYERQGKLQEAEQLYIQADTLFERVWGPEYTQKSAILNNLGNIFLLREDFKKAEEIYKQVSLIDTKNPHTLPEETVGYQSSLAYIYEQQGRYEEAETLYREALTTSQQTLGLEHPTVASILHHQARLFAQLGRYGKAEAGYQRALAIRQAVLKPDDFMIAETLYCLAELHKEQKNYRQAEPLYQQALKILPTNSGEEYPAMLNCLDGLGEVYFQQDRYKNAASVYQQILEIYKKRYGEEHSAIADSMYNLAHAYLRQGCYADAEQLYREALQIEERLHGEEHPYTQACRFHLAYVYEQQGRYAEAEVLYKQVNAIGEQIEEHAGIYWYTLATFHKKLGKHEQTEQLYQKALAKCEQVFGELDHRTTTCLYDLASFYRESERYEAAEPLYERVRQIYDQLTDVDSFQKIRTVKELADISMHLHKYAQAQPLYQQFLAYSEQTWGTAHIITANSLHNLGNSHLFLKQTVQAEASFQRALKIYQLHPEKSQADQFVEIITLQKLGQLLSEQDRPEAAEPMYKRELELREQFQGPEHLDTIVARRTLARTYEKQKKYEEALSLHQVALAIYEKMDKTEDMAMMDCLNNLAAVFTYLGKHSEALLLLQRAQTFVDKTSDNKHIDNSLTLTIQMNLASTYATLGHIFEAEQVYLNILARNEKLAGGKHLEMEAVIQINLAHLYYDQGKLDEAEPLLRQVMTFAEQHSGWSSPLVLASTESLINIFMAQGQYDLAAHYFPQLLVTLEKNLGHNHPSMAQYLHILAEICMRIARYEEAARHCLHALHIYEKTVGPDHALTAECLYMLGTISAQGEQYDKARSLCQRALDIYEKTLGADAPKTADCVYTLAKIANQQGQANEANSLCQRALAIYQHRALPLREVECRHSLAHFYHKQGKNALAQAAFQEGVALAEKALPPEHAERRAIQSCYQNLLEEIPNRNNPQADQKSG